MKKLLAELAQEVALVVGWGLAGGSSSSRGSRGSRREGKGGAPLRKEGKGRAMG
jgi:hypothetical protein